MTPGEKAEELYQKLTSAQLYCPTHFRGCNACAREILATALREARDAALEEAARRADNCAHSCVSEQHCDFLHAAHAKLAREIRSLKSAPAESATPPKPGSMIPGDGEETPPAPSEVAHGGNSHPLAKMDISILRTHVRGKCMCADTPECEDTMLTMLDALEEHAAPSAPAKVELTKEWCMAAAEKEAGSDVSAGHVDAVNTSPGRVEESEKRRHDPCAGHRELGFAPGRQWCVLCGGWEPSASAREVECPDCDNGLIYRKLDPLEDEVDPADSMPCPKCRAPAGKPFIPNMGACGDCGRTMLTGNCDCQEDPDGR